MGNRQMSRHPFVAVVLLLCVAVSGALPAQSARFQAERDRLSEEAAATAKALGFEEHDARYMDYPPATLQQVQVRKVAPGASAPVALAGTIPSGVIVLSERDGAVLSGATHSATSFSAHMTVAPTEGPGFVRLWTVTPVSASFASVPVVFIDATWRFDLAAADGLTIRLFPVDKSFTIEDDRRASLAYQAEFYKPGETTPFETRVGAMSYAADDEPQLRMDISLWEPKSTSEAEIEELSAKLADPNLTDADREAIAGRLAVAQQRMMEDLMKTMSTDPAVLNKQQEDFGCRLVQVYPETGYAVQATVLCGNNFHGGVLETTGTMTLEH